MDGTRYRRSLAEAMRLPVETFDAPGTTVVVGEDRRGSRLAVHYPVGRHAVLWSDPDLGDVIARFADPSETIPIETLREEMAGMGAEVLGAAVEHLLPGAHHEPARPSGVRVLDGDHPEVAGMVERLMATCSTDDLENADFDIERLDRFLVGWVDDDELLAVGGGRDFVARPGFVDVGVLVRPSSRRAGVGRAVIAALVTEVLAAGEVPLYRCGTENQGSRRLCRGLGFEQVLRLEAFELPSTG